MRDCGGRALCMRSRVGDEGPVPWRKPAINARSPCEGAECTALGSRRLVGYYIALDKRFFNAEFKRAGMMPLRLAHPSGTWLIGQSLLFRGTRA